MTHAEGTSTKRIGLFGGTFDPPHIGHLVAALHAREQLDLDEVWFVVANVPWQKEGTRLITNAQTRVDLARLAVAGVTGCTVSTIEIDRGGDTYTIDTLEALEAEAHGSGVQVEWWVIVGTDAASGLESWHRADALRARARFGVVHRPGVSQSVPDGWSWSPVSIPSLDVSSTELRRMVGEGRSIRFLTPDAVVHRVEELGLYRPGP